MWGGEEVLYSCLACVQKRQNCNFVPRRLSMIVGVFIGGKAQERGAPADNSQ